MITKEDFDSYCFGSTVMGMETFKELDRYPDKQWPVYLDEWDNHLNYFDTDGYCVVEVQAVRPGKSQHEFWGACVIDDHAKLLAILLNTINKNKYYDRKNLRLTKENME